MVILMELELNTLKKIALYVHQKDHITKKEQEERARGKSGEIGNFVT